MSIAASIASAVLKSVVGDKLGSGLAKDLIGISIDEASEKGINEITDFINGEKSKMDSILSKENMKSMGIPEDSIDYVVAEIKDLFSKISITDEVLRQCKYDSMNLSVFLWNEYRESKSDYIECESDIKRCLFVVAEALIKLVRESENFEKDVLIHISNTVDTIRVEEQANSHNLNAMFEKMFKYPSYYNGMALTDIWEIEKTQQEKIKTRTQEYAKKWNENMFLNNFNVWDENAGVNVKLSDVYIDAHLPHFIYGNNERISDNLDAFLSKHIIKNNSKQLLNNNSNQMLLVLGQPGVGKSTLITWITAKFNEYIENILVYKFAEDLKNVNWKKNNISKKILNKLNLSYDKLEGKTLILDGFDEVSVDGDRRRVLDNLYGELIYKKNINDFSLIITCRENYIQGLERVKCKYIVLQPWDEIQIRSFCNVFASKTKKSVSDGTKEKLLENKEILGIPLILYMVLALNISIEKEGSIVDVYDKIFSLEGGIYDRCIDNKKFAEGHRIGDVKKQIHQISRDIAIWMFENDANKASIPQEEYQKICRNIIQDGNKSKEIEQDFLIGNFFRLVKHCEGIDTEELYFVHRTIYEYFVAETIYCSIENAMIELSEKSQEEFAGKVAVYLKQGCVNYFIAEYLQYKILKLYVGMSEEKQRRFYQWWESAVNKMMECGMFYYTGKNVSYFKNIISAECRCFLNLIEVLRLLMDIDNREYIMENAQNELVEKYIKFCCIEYKRFSSDKIMDFSKMFLQKVNLKGIQLKGICLNQVNLERADLVNVDLSKLALLKANLAYADLRGANLEDAALMEADLRGADLTRANLKGAKLDGTKLVGADLKKADLRGVDLTGAYIEEVYLNGALIDDYQVPQFEKKLELHDVKVFINKTQEIVGYDEYYKSKK